MFKPWQSVLLQLIFLLLIVACAIYVKFIYKTMDHIIDHIYVSDLAAAEDHTMLKTHNIKTIIVIRSNKTSDAMLHLYRAMDIEHYHFWFRDCGHEPIHTIFDDTYNIMNNNSPTRGNILVHCNRGRSRSVTIVMLYLIRKYQMTADEACHFVQDKRWFIGPNQGFIQQLKTYA